MGVHWGVSDEGTAQFLSRLWESQVATGLNDAGLARIIGVNQSTIHCLKKGAIRHMWLTSSLRRGMMTSTKAVETAGSEDHETNP
jgi:hypothetical protein